MAVVTLPEEVVVRFRAGALERVERLEAAWNALLESPSDAGLARELKREMHTLKGDSRVLGFTDVNLLCHKLEDLLGLAHERRYAVPDEFGVVVTMGFGFLAMMLRKSPSRSMRGIDLPGFIVTLDEALSDLRSRGTERPPGPTSETHPSLFDVGDRVSFHTRAKLGGAAADVYVASLAARGAGKKRLYDIWLDLRRQVSALSEIPLGRRLEPHLFATRELARTLGKEVDVVFDVAHTTVQAEIAAALDAALLHALRNAVDHGVESPRERRERKKPEVASVVVKARDYDDHIELTLEDDGRGIDLEEVRSRASELGLLGGESREVSERALIELLFRPGFSTARQVTDLSGRGVGLDAARAAVARQRGEMKLAPRSPGGVRVTIRFPHVRRHVQVHPLIGSNATRLAVTTDWSVTEGRAGHARGEGERARVVDPFELLGIGGEVSGEVVPSIVHLARGSSTLSLAAAYVGTPVTADRVCPTLDDHPYEVVSVDGTELLLLRPEVVTSARE